MREPGIGRVLVASLHQAISDLMPTRLGFYENWLNAEGLREGTIGLAPLYAVLSFLRQEGEVYQMIMTRAGEYAADWTVESIPPVRRTVIRTMPEWFRVRMILRQAAKLVHNTYQGSRAISRLRRGAGTVELRASIFCTVREPVAEPLCGFYVAAVNRLMAKFDVQARTGISTCRGTGEPACILSVAIAGARSPASEHPEPA
jgi:bacteriochlorophyll 4-vinyl reductase